MRHTSTTAFDAFSAANPHPARIGGSGAGFAGKGYCGRIGKHRATKLRPSGGAHKPPPMNRPDLLVFPPLSARRHGPRTAPNGGRRLGRCIAGWGRAVTHLVAYLSMLDPRSAGRSGPTFGGPIRAKIQSPAVHRPIEGVG